MDTCSSKREAIGADFLATGHHARVRHCAGAPSRLMRARDSQKDQSYVLSVLSQEQLRQALFPIGEFTKPEIRKARSRSRPAQRQQEG